MSHHITWIIDNDPKGETGRGTLFGCRFKIDGIEHLKSYHLLDQIENNLMWQEIKTLAKLAEESNQRIQQQRNSEFEINRQANKKAQEDSKIANIKITKEIRDAINIVLEEYKQLVEQYKAGSEKANKTFDTLEKTCVENCLIKIQIALSNHNSSEKTVKVYVTDIEHISKQVCEKVSNELKQLDIQHTYNHWAGDQREPPETWFKIQL